jgi:putative colanic acid biosynthesis glycosyltransferase
MKILQVNSVYKKGSTGKIISDIHTVLKERNYESVVCYGRGEKFYESSVYKTSSEISAKWSALSARITGIPYASSYYSTSELINVINKEKPDIVHLQCINGFFVNIYKLLNFLKRENIKTVLTLHAEFMYTGSCGHAFECEKWKSGCGKCPQLWEATKSLFFDRTDTAWLKMRDAFKDFHNLTIVSVSGWLEDRAKQSPILRNKKFVTIENGIDTENVFHRVSYEHIKKKLELGNEKILLHVTSNFSDNIEDIKGGHYIIDLANRLKDENIKILVIGRRNNQLKLPNNIIYVGVTNNQKELAAFYSLADLSIITSRRETFSMPCAESLSCGTPVVGFRAGAPEAISLKEYSEFVEYGNMDELEKVVRNWIGKKPNLTSSISEIASQHYSKERMGERYIAVYKELLK